MLGLFISKKNKSITKLNNGKTTLHQISKIEIVQNVCLTLSYDLSRLRDLWQCIGHHLLTSTHHILLSLGVGTRSPQLLLHHHLGLSDLLSWLLQKKIIKKTFNYLSTTFGNDQIKTSVLAKRKWRDTAPYLQSHVPLCPP